MNKKNSALRKITKIQFWPPYSPLLLQYKTGTKDVIGVTDTFVCVWACIAHGLRTRTNVFIVH